MDLVPKITRLTKLPELLKQKQEAEEQSRKKREQERDKKDRPHFEIEDEATFSSNARSELKSTTPAPAKKAPITPSEKESEGLGEHVDFRV